MKNLSRLSDADLVAGFRDTVIDEHAWLAHHLSYLAELDRRRLFFEHASLRAYLISEFGIDAQVADRRIRAARWVRRYPGVLEKIEAGKLSMTHFELMQGVVYRERLSDPQIAEVIELVSGLSTRAAQRELAARFPQFGDELPKDQILPLDAEHSQVRFVAPEALLEKLEEIKALLAHSHPGITLAQLIDLLATDYRKRHHPEAKAQRAEQRNAPTSSAPKAPEPAPQVRSEPRFFSKAQAHALILRDGYRCSYKDPVTLKGCTSTYGIQIDHILSWFRGGKTELSNARLLCASHHRRITYLEFGERRACSKSR